VLPAGTTRCARKVRFAADSALEGDGFKLLVPGRETVKPSWGDRTAVLTTAAELSRNRWFESVFLQRGVICKPVFSKLWRSIAQLRHVLQKVEPSEKDSVLAAYYTLTLMGGFMKWPINDAISRSVAEIEDQLLQYMDNLFETSKDDDLAAHFEYVTEGKFVKYRNRVPYRD
jgi:hypothetical protein